MYYKKYLLMLTSPIFSLVNGVLPPRCAISGQIVDRVGGLSAESWGALTFIGRPFCKCCGMPFQIVEDGVETVEEGERDESVQTGQLCGPCLSKPKAFSRARSIFVYDDVSRGLILAFKHGDHTHLTATFTPLLGRAGAELFAQADLVVAVPLHWTRLIRRRYNQAALLARSLGLKEKIRFEPHLLKRIRATPPQGHKSARDRHENVHKAFVVPAKEVNKLNGKTVLLVDDVYTTGATLEECAQTLIDAGARQVDVLTLARVVKSH